MKRRSLMTVLLLAAASHFAPGAAAQDNANFPDRRALILNVSPHIEVMGFRFGNSYSERRTRFQQSATWRNIGQQPVVAFEMVVMNFDAFDERMIGTRWTVTGTNSADWRPLQPGAIANDGTLSLRSEEVFTAIIYVRAVRLADGTIWRANMAQVLAEAQKVGPTLRGLGNMEPDPPPRRD